MCRVFALLGLARVSGVASGYPFGGPALLGEVFAGFVLGPSVLNLIPFVEILTQIGLIGLLLLVFQQGLNCDISWVLSDGIVIGIAPALIAMIISGFSTFLGVVLLYFNGVPFLESICCGTAVSTMVVTFADTGWTSVSLRKLARGRNKEVVGNMIASVGRANCVLSLCGLAILQGYDSGSSSWVNSQPTVFSVGIVLTGLALRQFWVGLYHGWNDCTNASSCGNQTSFLAIGFMLAFAIAMSVLAQIIQSTYVLGAFMGGVCFSGLDDARTLWKDQASPLTRWLALMFFACSIGFAMPVADSKSIVNGFLLFVVVASGRFVLTFILSYIFLGRIEMRVLSSAQAGSAVVCQGGIGFIVALEFYKQGLLTQGSFQSVLWALLASTFVGPILLYMLTSLAGPPEATQMIPVPRKTLGNGLALEGKGATQNSSANGACLEPMLTTTASPRDVTLTASPSPPPELAGKAHKLRETLLKRNGNSFTPDSQGAASADLNDSESSTAPLVATAARARSAPDRFLFADGNGAAAAWSPSASPSDDGPAGAGARGYTGGGQEARRERVRFQVTQVTHSVSAVSESLSPAFDVVSLEPQVAGMGGGMGPYSASLEPSSGLGPHPAEPARLMSPPPGVCLHPLDRPAAGREDSVDPGPAAEAGRHGSGNDLGRGGGRSGLEDSERSSGRVVWSPEPARNNLNETEASPGQRWNPAPASQVQVASGSSMADSGSWCSSPAAERSGSGTPETHWPGRGGRGVLARTPPGAGQWSGSGGSGGLTVHQQVHRAYPALWDDDDSDAGWPAV